MTLKRRIEKIERALPDREISSLEYMEKYLEATTEEQAKMKRPRLTMDMLLELVSDEEPTV